MNRVPPHHDLSAALGILAALAIALTVFGISADDTRQMVGDLAAIIPVYVLHKSNEVRK